LSLTLARLALEDGWTALGRSVGAAGIGSGECVFNTCLSGYQEVLTDPSYTGQIVVMT
jgi:carbamoyl-phosphate synthase small subunit